ncbi:VOC family protein [Rhizobium sp. ZPR3]|uniref:VOC family protein n=2 Tax=unclassified Rhizobium TaxID=2613769 RepID=A0AAU7SR83_9HYPH
MTDKPARTIPGLLGLDHIGITVPDLDEAVAFFAGLLGCQKVLDFGPVGDDQGSFMTDVLGVHARARIERAAVVRTGRGSNIELVQYSAPDQRDLAGRNSDTGAFHLGLYVRDIAVAKAFLDEAGITTRFGPVPINDGPIAGQSILYFRAPWGLELEAVSYPNGMAYEAESEILLWDPRKPD